jgi:hypothetical protein
MTWPDCEMPALTETAEGMPTGPPWWLHAILLGLSVLLIVAAVMFFAWTAV